MSATLEAPGVTKTSELPLELAMTAIERQQQEDALWAVDAPEVMCHEGNYVAIRQKRVLGVGLDRDALVDEVARSVGCPWWEIVVEWVPRPELVETPR